MRTIYDETMFSHGKAMRGTVVHITKNEHGELHVKEVEDTDSYDPTEQEDITSPGYTIAWALAGFALFWAIIGAVVMKIAMGG